MPSPLPAPLPWPCRLRPRCLSLPLPRPRPASSFHTSTTHRDPDTNHYETLNIPPNATAAEIKKQYFHLSKTHHPDHNPTDPHSASARFVKIAEAYAILGSASKRQRYDRDFPHLHHNHHHHMHNPSSSAPHRHGSHHSSSSAGPAGARPASGLSKRRTHFRGPPPSFYRAGGWGAYGAKRTAQADAAAGAAGPSAASSSSGYAASGGANGSGAGGGGGGGGGFGAAMGWGNDVPHFDRDGHFRTQEQQELRRRRRMAAAEDAMSIGGGKSLLLNFVFVGGIISLAIAVPTFFGRMVERRPKGEVG